MCICVDVYVCSRSAPSACYRTEPARRFAVRMRAFGTSVEFLPDIRQDIRGYPDDRLAARVLPHGASQEVRGPHEVRPDARGLPHATRVSAYVCVCVYMCIGVDV